MQTSSNNHFCGGVRPSRHATLPAIVAQTPVVMSETKRKRRAKKSPTCTGATYKLRECNLAEL